MVEKFIISSVEVFLVEEFIGWLGVLGVVLGWVIGVVVIGVWDWIGVCFWGWVGVIGVVVVFLIIGLFVIILVLFGVGGVNLLVLLERDFWFIGVFLLVGVVFCSLLSGGMVVKFLLVRLVLLLDWIFEIVFGVMVVLFGIKLFFWLFCYYYKVDMLMIIVKII